MATEASRADGLPKKLALLVGFAWLLLGSFALLALGLGLWVAFDNVANGLGAELLQKQGLDVYRLDDFNWISALILLAAVVVVFIVGGLVRLRGWMAFRTLRDRYEEK